MSLCASRISLYWLDDHESYLGEERCSRPSVSWFSFGADTHGTLCLATKHFFFDDGSDSVVIFPLRYLEGVTLDESSDQLVLSFVCRRGFRREVLPCTGAQPAVPGPCVANPSTDTWVFRIPCRSECFVELLRRLVGHQRIEDILSRREIALQAAPSAVTFRVRRQVPMREQRGVLHITDTHVAFVPLFAMASHGAVTLKRGECAHSFPRWVVFEAVGLDLCTSAAPDQAPALSLVFCNTQERDQAQELLRHRLGVPPYTVSPHATAEAWKRGEMSNYEYLLHLNKWASRCFNDVFQYPVFPWVLSDYESARLVLSAPSTFRDLSKPIGALSPDRLGVLRERAHFLDEAEEETYLYSTHYSSAGVVAYYLVRPHPEFQLCLQGGTLDVAERIMESIAQVWHSVTTNTSNFRELIPAFFNDDFNALCGPPRIALGAHSSGRPVSPYVELPPWAANTHEFVRLHREALESEYVSEHLHLWIDLIFGAAQNGEAARAADNLFHPFSYRQWTRKSTVRVPGLHLSPHEYAREFGNVPMQLFSGVHPARSSFAHGVQCTVEALNTCGGDSGGASGPSASPHHQRIVQMMAALQSAGEDPGEPGLSVDLSTEDKMLDFSSLPATLVEVSNTTLPCTSARFATIGVLEGRSESAVLLVVGDNGRIVTLFSALTGERLRSFPDFEGQTTATAYHAGSMYVFTDNKVCYVISISSHSVTNCFTELTAASVEHASFFYRAVLLADTEAQLLWWDASRCTGATQLPFDVAPTLSCEASSRILCVGGAARTCAGLAISVQREVFLFHNGDFSECTLHNVPEDAEVLNAAAADSSLGFWVFFHAEAVFYNEFGLWLRRIPFPAASAVLCAHLREQLYPLCLYSERLPLELHILQHTDNESVVELCYCRLVWPRASCTGATLALIGRTCGETPTASLFLTVATLRAIEAK